MKQLALPLALAPERSFESFVPGANALALASLRALAGGEGDGAPVYLWGPAGSGKSHLLEAVAQQWRQDGGRVVRLDADVEPLPELDAAPALIVFDDCDRYDATRQHAAFTLFVEAAGLALPLLAAGRVPPVDLPLREDLRSRLGWGHVLALQPLSESQARDALKSEAERRSLHLADDLLDYLMRHFPRDLKHLTQQLDALDAYAMVNQRAPTLHLLRQMLAHGGEEA